jgi:hypothetical protein
MTTISEALMSLWNALEETGIPQSKVEIVVHDRMTYDRLQMALVQENNLERSVRDEHLKGNYPPLMKFMGDLTIRTK